MLRSESLIFSPATHALGIRASEEAGSRMPPSALSLAKFRKALLEGKAVRPSGDAGLSCHMTERAL
jgi:hypothetical protein